MALYEYKKGQLKSGFAGFRVSVSVNGEIKQKYFSYRNKTKEEIEGLRKKAGILNDEWIFQKNLHFDRRERECKEKRRNSPYVTGVSGIKMKFAIMRKKRGGTIRTYYTPIFDVHGSTKSKTFTKKVNIKVNGFDYAWFLAVSFYAEKKGISNYSHILAKKPPVEQYFVITKYLRDKGHDIPKRRLPDELDDHEEGSAFLKDKPEVSKS